MFPGDGDGMNSNGGVLEKFTIDEIIAKISERDAKVREWFLYKSVSDDSDTLTAVPRGNDPYDQYANMITVIEKSAYDQLLTKVRELEAEVERLTVINQKLLEENTHIENRVLNKAADFTTKRQLEMNSQLSLERENVARVAEALEAIANHTPESMDKVVLLINIDGYREVAKETLDWLKKRREG